jgi:CRP-like cAMP-binding protein
MPASPSPSATAELHDGPSAVPTLDERLSAIGLRPVGQASACAADIRALMAAAPLFSGLADADAERLAAFFFVHDAPAGVTVITEGEIGDFMLLVMTGEIEVVRGGRRGARIAVARAGQSLGEMSMFDGEPRFASCVTLGPSRIAVLSRDAMMRVMEDEPRLGGQVMLRLVHLLSERLRQMSARLVTEVEARREA